MPDKQTARPSQTTSSFVGRDDELAALQACWSAVHEGRRQIILVSGAAGVGKSALLDAWLQRLLHADDNLLHGIGHCLEQRGGAAYLAFLDAVGRLCQGSHGARVKAFLYRYAPSWAIQLPALLVAAEREQLRQELFGATGERMLRELAEFLEALSLESPLVVILENLQWADPATLDVLVWLARRQEPARLCVIGTLRPALKADPNHPLERLRHDCRELVINPLGMAELGAYLQHRLPNATVSQGLAAVLHHHTGGHPLFLGNAVDYLLATEMLKPDDGRWVLNMPADEDVLDMSGELDDVLGRQLRRLSALERRILDAASVAHAAFTAEAVAALLGEDAADACRGLAQGGLWLELGEDGAGRRYRFIHALHRAHFYESLPAAYRQRLHARLAEHLEAMHGVEADAIAADLAHHFERGGAPRRAIHYLQRAAAVDRGRLAPRAAVRHLDRADALLERVPAGERTVLREQLLVQRNALLMASGQLAQAIAGFGELAELARARNDAAGEAQALLGLGGALFWVDRRRCLAIADQALARSKSLADPLLRAHTQGLHAHWHSLVDGYRPEHDGAYQAALGAARTAGDRNLECQHTALLAYLLGLRSEYAAACTTAEQGLRLAKEIGDGHHYLVCQFFRAWALFYAGRWREMQAVLDDGLAMAAKNGHRPWVTHFLLQQAWLQIETHAYADAERVCEPLLEQIRASGAQGSEYFLGLIAASRLHLGRRRLDQAGACLAEVDARLRDSPKAIDWILRLPLQLVRCEHHHAEQRWEALRETAAVLRDLATGPQERTYGGVAQAFLAEGALARGDLDGAAAAIQAGQALLSAGTAPLAAWRLHAVAARRLDLAAQPVEAERERRASAALLAELDNSASATSDG